MSGEVKQLERYPESERKRTTFGIGLLKGLAITLRHLVSPSVTVHYPDEIDAPPARSRGVIALKTENCTVCMLCARECPDWCIYIEGHKESRAPKGEGKRAKKYNVLDRFAIDYALCMYCGICVEVCPYDALFWSPAFEYAELDVVELTHEQQRLNQWMSTVLAPAELDEGAQGPELKVAPAPPPAAAQGPAEQAKDVGVVPAAVAAAGSEEQAPVVTPASSPQLEQPAATAQPPSGPKVDPDEVHKKVLAEELAKGSDPRVAEGRAKSAAMKARRAGAAPGASPALSEKPEAPPGMQLLRRSSQASRRSRPRQSPPPKVVPPRRRPGRRSWIPKRSGLQS